ncbi:MAG TPA: PepSY domain-containing protein [Gemmatimonadaceae bacterium]|nr:PepSY domain-containing protein [Gemmatimonadaceae bacterium]
MRRLTLFGGVAAIGFTATPALAQQPSYKRDLPDSLARQARVTEAAAIAVAKKAVPNGKVSSIELEREGGRLIYSMDVKAAGKSGTDEVNVDAKTGKMIGKVQHESAAAEQAEAKAERAEAKKGKKKP